MLFKREEIWNGSCLGFVLFGVGEVWMFVSWEVGGCCWVFVSFEVGGDGSVSICSCVAWSAMRSTFVVVLFTHGVIEASESSKSNAATSGVREALDGAGWASTGNTLGGGYAGNRKCGGREGLGILLGLGL